MHRKRSAATRFWSRVKVDDNGCWLWQAKSLHLGYGQIRNDDGVIVMVHRWSYELLVGPIPEGLQLDHLCRVRHCVNPRHLEPVTQQENIRRGMAPAAINARKTHCKRGHPFDAANTYIPPSGRRVCKACNSMHFHNYYLRRKAAGH